MKEAEGLAVFDLASASRAVREEVLPDVCDCEDGVSTLKEEGLDISVTLE